MENIVKKGENAGDQHFLLFQPCLLTVQEQLLSFENISSIWTCLTFFYEVKG